MGLDISVYTKLQKVDAVFNEHGEPIDPQTRAELGSVLHVYVNPDFPGRAGDLTDRGVYSYDNYYGFCAGSYGGYNGWRESLAKMAGYPSGKYEQYGKDWDSHCVACWDGQLGPFSELINFSDCEGVIGAKVAAKLAQDFAEHQQKVDAHPDDRFRRLYGEWRKAFEMAKDNGAVHFH